MLFPKTLVHDYEYLCNLDVLGFKNKHRNKDKKLFNQFQIYDQF